ncbi:MAG: hypothetical protein GY697_18705, partial [Desulfobacterales bacterium]|nr:hypothetical protein [Desulfobacterales bacterium]
LNESAEERIQSLLEMVRSGIGFIMEDDETRERARQIASFSTTVAALSGNMANDQQTVETALDEQHTTMKPLLHKTARAIHEVLKVSPE